MGPLLGLEILGGEAVLRRSTADSGSVPTPDLGFGLPESPGEGPVGSTLCPCHWLQPLLAWQCRDRSGVLPRGPPLMVAPPPPAPLLVFSIL